MYYFNAMNKAKKISVLFLAVASAVLGGCSSLTNLSPESVPENASRIYTLSMSAYINDGSLVKDSIEPFIVIDEQVIPMKEVKDMKYDRIYEYDYVMPKGRKDAKYYFMLKYKVDNTVKGVSEERVIKSRTVYELKPVSRYVVNIQNERGPVGSEVPVLGRGFDKLDKITIGGVEADTEYLSRSTINFTVPPLEAGKNYDVNLVGSKGDLWIGQFRVDPAEMQVSPASITMKSSDVTNLIFNIGFAAPKGGYPIDVKTNIPSSIIMDEVVVPEGQTSTSVSLKAAAAGKGALYINGVGFNEKVVPVEVITEEIKLPEEVSKENLEAPVKSNASEKSDK